MAETNPNTNPQTTNPAGDGQQAQNQQQNGVVRHPMYFATVLLFWSIPLVLGSLYSFLVFLPYPLLLVRRIRDEEELLAKELSGYREYQEKVRYRLIPFVW